MTQQNKLTRFQKAVRKLYDKSRPKRWRALYRTVHQIKATQDNISNPTMLERAAQILLPTKTYEKLSEIPYAYQFAKLSVLQHHRGKRTKDLARMIMQTMINDMLETGNDLIVLNYAITDTRYRMEFVAETLMNTHRKISEQIPEVSPALKRVIFDPEYNQRKKKSKNDSFIADAYYSRAKKQIGFCPEGLDGDDIAALANTMAHEYVHVLQSVYESTLPTPILKLSWQHHNTMHKFPHDLRPIEKEANRVGRLVGHNFQKYFDKLSNEYYATHD